MNREDGVVLIELAGEEMLHSEGGQKRLKMIQLEGQLSLESGVAAFLRQLQQRRDVAQFRFDVVPLLELALQFDFPAADAGGRPRVAPEIGLAHLGFEFLQLGGHA